MKPLNKFVAVEIQEQPKTTASGIIVATSNPTDTTLYGKVTDVGGEVTMVTQDEIVIFPRAAGMTVKHNGKTYRFLLETDIIASV